MVIRNFGASGFEILVVAMLIPYELAKVEPTDMMVLDLQKTMVRINFITPGVQNLYSYGSNG
jgi:hypothetical protein